MNLVGRAARLRAHLIDAPTDIASLAAFRILFGLLLTASMVRFVALGWIDEFYVIPKFHFTWELFPWVAPLPGVLMHVLFLVLTLLAVAISLGWHYRISVCLFFIGFTYIELIDKTTYLNHYYLVSLLTGLLSVLPAHRAWSFDVHLTPGLATQTVPAWTVNLLRFQVAVVFVFAGLAKINVDWLLEAQPLRIWLAARSDIPVLGSLLAQPWMAFAFSWFGAAYDLAIVFLLLWHRTRPMAYLTVIVFHAMTALLFPIGMFPWIMIVATTIFFPANWPRRWLGRGDVPSLDASRAISGRTMALIGFYAAVQIALPLRAYWPGVDADWTYQGFNFAWRVMLIEKSGATEFIASDRLTGTHWRVSPREYLTERQEKMMAQDPYMVRALARHIGATFRLNGVAGVEVRAESFAAMNGRAAQRLIDPTIDLTGPTRPGWIVPLHERAELSFAKSLRR